MRTPVLRCMFLSCAITGTLLSGNAGATRRTIDDFKSPDPPLTVVIDNGGVFHPNNQPIPMPGTSRDVLVELLGGPDNAFASLRVGSQPGALRKGVLDFATRGIPSARLTLQYDGQDLNDDEWTNEENLRSSVSRWSRFRFYFDHAENGGGVEILLTGEGDEWATSGAGFSPTNGRVSALSPEIRDFQQSPGFKDVAITSYTFVFPTGGDTKFRLASVRIVPEPQSWALVLSGAVGAILLGRVRGRARV